jgi:ethanolamine ammonia-lyase small subunit
LALPGLPPAPAAPAIVQEDAWTALRAMTPARVALGRTGASLPTREILRFGAAHALARDAVHAALDAAALAARLDADGWPCDQVASAAPDRAAYLLRPDLGRQLDARDILRLQAQANARAAAGLAPPDLVFVIGDGLSALAAANHAQPLLAEMRTRLPGAWVVAPVVIAMQARVALGDAVGEALGARMVAVLIGERPGLSSPDSLGVYLTLHPRIGTPDARRNCISNIRPAGLSYAHAAHKLAWLAVEAARMGTTGVALKDLSDVAGVSAAAGAASLEAPR